MKGRKGEKKDIKYLPKEKMKNKRNMERKLQTEEKRKDEGKKWKYGEENAQHTLGGLWVAGWLLMVG